MFDTCQAAYNTLWSEFTEGFAALLHGRGLMEPTMFGRAFDACATPLPFFLVTALGIWIFTRARGCIPHLGFVLSIMGIFAFGGAFALFWLIFSFIFRIYG